MKKQSSTPKSNLKGYSIILFMLAFQICSVPGVSAQSFYETFRNLVQYSDGQYSGKGKINIFKTTVDVSAPLTTSREDLEFSGTVKTDLSMQDLLIEITQPTFYYNVIPDDFKGFVGQLKFPNFTFRVKPFSNELTLVTTNNLGKQEIAFEKGDDAYVFTFTYTLPEGHKLSSIHSGLQTIDEFNIIKQSTITLAIELGNEGDGTSSGTPQNHSNTSNGWELQVVGQIDKDKFNSKIKTLLGLEGKKHKSLDDFLNNLPELEIMGAFDKSLNTKMGVVADFNLPLGEGWVFEQIDLILEMQRASPLAMFLKNSIIIPIEEDKKLRFKFGINSEPPNAVGLDFLLTALDANNQEQEWYKPYGIPFLTFNKIGGGVSVDATTALDQIKAEGDLMLGVKPKSGPDSRIPGKLDVVLDADPAQNKYHSKLSDMTLLKIIKAFGPEVVLPGFLQTVLDIGVDNAEFKLDAKEGAASIAGKLSFFDFASGRLNVAIAPTSGAKIGGQLDPIKFKPGGIEIFSINAAGNPASGALFDIKLDGEPKMDLTGEVRIFGVVGNSSKMFVDKNGINVSTEVKFPLLMSGKMLITGNDFIQSGALQVKGAFKPEFTNLAQEVEKYIRKYGGAVAGEIVKVLLNGVFMVDSISMNSRVNKSTTQFDFLISYTAIGKNFSFNLPLDVDFAQPKKIPETIAKLAAAIGEQIIYNSGELVLKIFEDGVKLAETALVAVGETAQKAAKELEKLVNDPVAYLNALGKDIEGLINPKKEFPEAKNGPPSEYVKTGYRHYELSFKTEGFPEGSYYGMSGVVLHKPENANNIIKQIVDPPKAYFPNGTNPVLASVNEDSTLIIKKGTYISPTKHFYVKENENVDLLIINNLWLQKPTILVKDQAISYNKTIKNLSALPDGAKPFDISVPLFPMKVTFTVFAHPMMTKKLLLADILSNNFNGLKEKIKKGGDLETIKEEAMSAAVSAKNKEVIELLVTRYNTKTTSAHLDTACNAGADPNFIFLILRNLGAKQHPTPRHINYALNKDAFWLADKMLDFGALPDNSNLSLALNKNYLIAKKIYDKGVVPTLQDLNNAVRNSNLAAVKLVLQKVVPEEPAFLLSAQANSTSIYQLLYAKGNETIATIEPAKMAINHKNLDILKMSLNKKVKPDMVIAYAVSKEFNDGIIYLLKQGADRKIALVKAIEGSSFGKRGPNMDIIKFIINCDFCKQPIDFSDPSYLATAVQYSRGGTHAEVVKLLLEKGADPNAYRDAANGNSLLHIASKKCRKYLYSPRAVIGRSNGKPIYFPFRKRVRRDHETMSALIAAKADVNRKNNKGYTSLHMASNKARKAKDIKLVKMMVDAGADVNACTAKGKSVYQIADGRKVKKYLRSKGAVKKACK